MLFGVSVARSTKKPLGYVCRLTSSEEDAYQSTEMVVIAAVALVPTEELIDTAVDWMNVELKPLETGDENGTAADSQAL